MIEIHIVPDSNQSCSLYSHCCLWQRPSVCNRYPMVPQSFINVSIQFSVAVLSDKLQTMHLTF